MGYYRDVLGFYDEWTWIDKNGQEPDGGIRRDDMRLLLGEAPDWVNTINSCPQNRLVLLWFVDTIDEVFQEFQDRRIEFADILRTHTYGLREFAFIDINGYIRVAERVEE